MLALTSLVALLFGPLGAIAAIVFGWAARREIDRSESRVTGYGLATLGLALGALFTMAWGAGLSILVVQQHHRDREAVAAHSEPASPSVAAPTPVTEVPAARAPEPPPGGSVPKNTVVKHNGAITVVDVGVSAVALDRELAKQRAEAAGVGETLMVMLTRDPCDPCRGVDASLTTQIMQTALAKVRLVRVDIDVFGDDLDGLKMPHSRFPAFFLLGTDLSPKDGIDGGEWDDDIAPNIAPVLGAFVRGKYGARRQVWHPLPGSGVQL
jgi:hypothetical protein